MGEIEAIRMRIGELKQEREAVAALPGTFAEARAVLASYLDTAEQTFGEKYLRQFLSGLICGAASSISPDPRVLPDHLAAMLAGLLRPALEANLTRALEQYCAQNPGLSAGERADQLARIDAQILAAEREEESLIRTAEQAGLIINRRPDASPRVVLADLSEGGG